MGQVNTSVPGPLQTVVPYRLMITPSEVYSGRVLAATFRAYQASTWPERYDDVVSLSADASSYWPTGSGMDTAWARRPSLNCSIAA